MEYVGFEPGRLTVRWISGSEGGKLVDTMREVSERITALGPNRKMRETD